MKIKLKNSMLPELRFPEFRDTAEWDHDKLETFYSFKSTNSLSRDKLTFDQGLVKNIHYGDIHTKYSSHFDIEREEVPYIIKSRTLKKIKSDNFCQESDVIFADASEDMDDVGKCIEVVNLSDQKVLSGLHTILARQKKKRFITGFAGHLFQSQRMRSSIQREAQGAKVLGISSRRLATIEVYYPREIAEQQKITDFLTSIDKLIKSEEQKLEKLEAHKKGLMQQLFPAESKTLPQIRFQEFRDFPEWKEKKLSEICDINPSEKQIPDIFIYIDLESVVDGELLKKTELKKEKAPSRAQRNIEYGDVLYQTVRPYQKNNLLCKFDDGSDFVASTGYALLRAKKSSEFLYYLIHTELFVRRVMARCAGGNYPAINSTDLKNITVLVPKHPEQEKIANFVSSIDTMLAAQAKKIAALQEHKKGLMQQLFPSVDEVMG